MATTTTLTFLTWNIHGRTLLGAREHEAEVAELIRRSGADVVALQEVAAVDGERGQAERIASLLGWHSTFAPNLLRGRLSFGNALLSRAPLSTPRTVDLSQPRREPRGCVMSESGGITFASVHLGLAHRERARQAARLTDALASVGGPLVVGGDMNDWFPGRDTRAMRARLSDVQPGASYPARLPLFRLDHVFHGPGVERVRAEVISSPIARAASDHLPVVATLAIAAGEAARTA